MCLSLQLVSYQAVVERDKIIEQLTELLNQSLQNRSQLHDRSDRLANEMSDVRKEFAESVEGISGTARKRNWLGTGNAADTSGQRLSEITLDLVSGSEYEDDDAHKKSKLREASDEKDANTTAMNISTASLLNQFRTELAPDELNMFSIVQDKFTEHIARELDAISKKNDRDMLLERNEKELEINRLKHIISNVKGGSTEVRELRQELESIHKKEMENLRMYFEQKCSDLEKQ